MAELDREALAKVAKLARVECSEEDQTKIYDDLQEILGYMAQLKEINTDDVVACNHVIADRVNVFRDDEVGETLDREEFLNNAPEHIGGMIRVPTVIQQS